MKAFYEDIAQKIDSGEYFEDAKDWYLQKYIYPVIERTFFILITVISTIISIMAVYVLIDFLPLKNPIPIAVDIANPTEEYAVVKYLGVRGAKEDGTRTFSNKIIITYISKKYVIAAESYDYKDNFQQLDRNFNYLKQFSINDITDRYRYLISIRNPDSLILKYKKHTKRTIKVKEGDIIIRQSTTNPSKYIAFIDFVATEINRHGNKITNHRAKLDLNFYDIKYNSEKKDFEPIEYKVTEYRSARMD